MIFQIVNETVRANCIREIEMLPLGAHKVDIGEIKRSCPQNRFYWAILKIIGDELGYYAHDLHDAMKSQFIGQENGKDLFGNLYIKPNIQRQTKKE